VDFYGSITPGPESFYMSNYYDGMDFNRRHRERSPLDEYPRSNGSSY